MDEKPGKISCLEATSPYMIWFLTKGEWEKIVADSAPHAN
jgi:hypothetical protein